MKNLILLIPGNPSVPGIYEPFVQHLVNDLHYSGEKIWKVLPHLGQCNQKIINVKINLKNVIDDHREVINDLIKRHNPDKVILLGHSLGSAVTINLYKDLDHIIDDFIILCPFMGPARNNLKYLKMFKHPVTSFGMKNLSHSILLSKKLSHSFFKFWLGDNPFNEHIPSEIKKPYYIKNFFSLVSSYVEGFEELDIPSMTKKMNPEKVFFLFAPNDYWVPDETINHLPKDSAFVKCSGISHDFCLREEQFRIVSQTVSQYLKNK